MLAIRAFGVFGARTLRLGISLAE